MSLSSRFIHSTKRFLMRVRREMYGLRAFIPGLKEHHRLEAMVGPLGYWKHLQQYQLRAVRSSGLEPSHRLLDIGCGPLQGGVAFIQFLEPAKYTGVDRDPVRIEAANSQVARLGLSGKQPTLLLSSTFGEKELNGDKFDFIWASQILYYFDEAKMLELFGFIRKRLNRGGKFLGDIHGPRHYEFRFPEGGVILYPFEKIQSLADREGLRARALGEIVQFGYPKRLSLHSNLLLEFTAKE